KLTTGLFIQILLATNKLFRKTDPTNWMSWGGDLYETIDSGLGSRADVSCSWMWFCMGAGRNGTNQRYGQRSNRRCTARCGSDCNPNRHGFGANRDFQRDWILCISKPARGTIPPGSHAARISKIRSDRYCASSKQQSCHQHQP